MPRRLPPLNSLKSFEAAGRLLSFTRAANELNVTQAAVSHQIKVIEDFLGFSLFIRYPRKLALTEQGRQLLPEVIEAFDKVSNAIGAISQEPSSKMISVRLAPSFAAKWLSPRLKYFWLQHPEIDLCLYHAHPAVEFDREQIDIAATYGKGDWPGVVVEQINANKGTIIDDTNVLIQAAVDGQGVALGSSTFVQDLLDSGRLIKPFDITLVNEFAYYVVCPEAHLKNPSVQAFKDWLLDLGEDRNQAAQV